jgi:hypothetical protein
LNLSNTYRVSPNRFWKVDGILRPGFKANAKFTFNGRTPTASSAASGWLDQSLITDEQKLVLLFRSSTASDWQISNAVRNTLSSTTDKFGNFQLDSLMLGEYALAELDTILGVSESAAPEDDPFQIYPNPVMDNIQISWKSIDARPAACELVDVSGKCLGYIPVFNTENFLSIPVNHLPAGTYFVRIHLNDKSVRVKQVIIIGNKN